MLFTYRLLRLVKIGYRRHPSLRPPPRSPPAPRRALVITLSWTYRFCTMSPSARRRSHLAAPRFCWMATMPLKLPSTVLP